MSGVAIYLAIATLLYKLDVVNLFPPCLWLTFFDFKCPGCGLTHAFLYLVKLDVQRAYEANGLIFIVVPAGILFLVRDYRMFLSRNKV